MVRVEMVVNTFGQPFLEEMCGVALGCTHTRPITVRGGPECQIARRRKLDKPPFLCGKDVARFAFKVKHTDPFIKNDNRTLKMTLRWSAELLCVICDIGT